MVELQSYSPVMKIVASWLCAFVCPALVWAALPSMSTSNSEASSGYWLELETVATHTEGTLEGQTTYRLYLNAVNATDYLSACSGDDNNPMVMESSSGTWYNDPLNSSWNASGLNPAFFGSFPELAFDSFLTLGAEDSNSPAAQHPSSINGAFDFTAEFEPDGGSNFTMDDELGGAWYIPFPGLEEAENHASFAGSDLRILVAQFTTVGVMSGQLQVQVFQEGDQDNEFRETLPFCSGDGECGGCTDETASNYDPEALYDDGSCLEAILGCTDELACNYNPEATQNDGSCDYLSCLVFGCTNPAACNYDPEAEYSDGSCEFVTCAGCMNEAACDFDPDATVAATCTDFTSCYGCTDSTAPNFDPDATFDDGSCEVPGCTIVGACNFDPNANVDDGSCDFFSCLPSGCLNPNACNFDPVAVLDDGSCFFAESGYDCDGNCLDDADGDGVCDENEIEGCTDSDALNYDVDATEDDGSCIEGVSGCQDPTACNYDPLANVGDDSCEFESCAGCLSDTACNYDPSAVYPAPCEFPEAGYDCDGNCLNDADEDGICDEFEAPGCTDTTACNYNAEATDDDESCEYAEEYYGCDGTCLNDADSDGICDDTEVEG